MPDFLNTLLRVPTPGSAPRILWRDLEGDTVARIGDLHHDLCVLHDRIAHLGAQRWLLYSDNPRQFLTGFLALLSAGREIVISASKKPEWVHTLRGGFDAILTDESTLMHIGAQGATFPVVDLRPSASKSGGNTGEPLLTGNEQIVFFTSGSTGEPKAVRKPLCALTNEIDTLAAVFGQQLRGAVFAASVSHLHIYGLLFRVLLPLAVDGSVLLQQIEYQEQLVRFRERFGRTAFISSPAFLSRLDPALPRIELDMGFSSGGPLPFAAAQESARLLSCYPIEVYGSTETGGIGYRQQQVQQCPWTLFPRMTLKSVDEGTELRSPHMPDVDCYLLDDQVEVFADGRFMLKGRRDRVMKIAEKRISLTEMEKFLEDMESIERCVVLPLREKRESVGCAVVLTEQGRALLAAGGKRALVDRWKTAMRARFDNVVIPRKWQVLSEIPLNSQSKIDTAGLLAGFTRNNAGRQ